MSHSSPVILVVCKFMLSVRTSLSSCSLVKSFKKSKLSKIKIMMIIMVVPWYTCFAFGPAGFSKVSLYIAKAESTEAKSV